VFEDTEHEVKRRTAEILNAIWTKPNASYEGRELQAQQVVLLAGILALLEQLVSYEDGRRSR
jgi:hypothetical protein